MLAYELKTIIKVVLKPGRHKVIDIIESLEGSVTQMPDSWSKMPELSARI